MFSLLVAVKMQSLYSSLILFFLVEFGNENVERLREAGIAGASNQNLISSSEGQDEDSRVPGSFSNEEGLPERSVTAEDAGEIPNPPNPP